MPLSLDCHISQYADPLGHAEKAKADDFETAILALTSKEREVLTLIGLKLNCNQAAAVMGISVFTVRKHRSSILRKLRLQTTAQLTAFALTTVRAARPQQHDLTPREAEVVGFVAHGLTSKEIARKLSISPLTVRKHRENAMRNLGVHCMADLMAAARLLGFSDTPSEPYTTTQGCFMKMAFQSHA